MRPATSRDQWRDDVARAERYQPYQSSDVTARNGTTRALPRDSASAAVIGFWRYSKLWVTFQ